MRQGVANALIKTNRNLKALYEPSRKMETLQTLSLLRLGIYYTSVLIKEVDIKAKISKYIIFRPKMTSEMWSVAVLSKFFFGAEERARVLTSWVRASCAGTTAMWNLGSSGLRR